MTLQKWRRKRGVTLTTKGLEKIQEAKRKLEEKENFGNWYTLEEISDRCGLYSATISKVFNREEGVDKKTIEKLFLAFGLKMDESDYLSAISRLDWGEAISTSVFYGRTEELTTLKQWILNENCQLVALLGIGGIGKTSLSVKFAQEIHDNFEYVIWRSLREAPPVKTILANLIQVLSNEQEIESSLPENLSDRVSRLLYYLQNHRCLLILDNAESILRGGSRAGVYREGYEGYAELLRRVGEASHQSSLVLTSREKPKEVALLEGKALPVRSLSLSGLKVEEGLEILKLKGLLPAGDEWKVIIEYYAGNPLALKIVATTIQDIFDGDVTEFLNQNTSVFGDIRDILEQQFERLSDLEKHLMYWLAINREPTAISELQEDIVCPVKTSKSLEALESLGRRSLIERAGAFFTLQPVVMEYVIGRLIEHVCEEIANQNIKLFRFYALMKATTKDYVKETQVRLILQPVIDGLFNIFGNKQGIQNQLTQILQKTPQLELGYTAGNILNLLVHLEIDLTGYDFSDLSVWQADLGNVNLHNVNFRNANLAKCVFAQTLGGIHSVVFSPDGKLLATGDTHGEIRLYQITDGKQLIAIKGHTGFIWPIAFSPDGQIVASGSDDKTVKLWDISTGQCLVILQGHSSGVWSVAFNSQSILASGSEDKTIKLWDVSTGQCLKTLCGHTNRVTSIVFSPGGHIIASGSDDQTVRLWDTSTGQCLKTLQVDHSESQTLAFSPDGRILASGHHNKTVSLWDVAIGHCFQTILCHTNSINSVAFSPDGKILASGSDDQTLKLWDISTGKCKTLSGHSSRVMSVAFSPDGNTLASGSEDQTVRLWDVTTGQCLKTWQGYCNGIWSIAFSPKVHIIASGSNDQKIKLWDAATGQCLKTLQGHTNRVTSVVFSPDGSILASGSEDKTVKIWDTTTGQCLKTLCGHTNRVTSVAFSPDGQIIASGCHDQTVRLWNIKTGQCFQSLHGHTHWVWAIAFSPDSSMLASGCHDQTVKLWDTATGQCLKTLHGHTDWIWSVAFSPDGRTLVSGSTDQTVRLWDIKTGECIETLRGHTSTVYSVAFLDACTLASSSGDQSVKLWDINTSTCVKTLSGHSKLVWSIAFSPNAQTLASGSQDDTIKLWNIKTGECLKTIKNSSLYDGMNIIGATGLTEAQKVSLQELGAFIS